MVSKHTEVFVEEEWSLILL